VEGWLAVVRLLNPITPHICETLWAALGENTPLYCAPWPKVDESARVRTRVTLVVQVNGKVRARLELEPGMDEDSALVLAIKDVNVQRHMDGKAVRKVIHVPDRLLNIVVG
jgi:leucyl-tRNA synthetase